MKVRSWLLFFVVEMDVTCGSFFLWFLALFTIEVKIAVEIHVKFLNILRKNIERRIFYLFKSFLYKAIIGDSRIP